MTITVADLTTIKIDGSGVFDVLMQATKAHLQSEFEKNRIKGPEYATVYLGSLEPVLNTALAFLMQRDKLNLETQILEQQLILIGVEVRKAEVELRKEEAAILQIQAQVELTRQQAANALIEQGVLQAQVRKIEAEIVLLGLNNAKTTQEIDLLLWKTNTEKAQTISAGTEDNSVIGKQKLLYTAQTTGFTRDAEQKATKLLIDTWNVRRTTDEGTIATDTGSTPNYLGDRTLGRAVSKLLAGVGVSTG